MATLDSLPQLAAPEPRAALPAPRLRLLSYNIQVGLDTAHFGHYFTGAWRHALPWREMHANLDRIAELMQGYDFVAIQEADAGSLRTQSVNQMEYLARRAGFTHWGLTVTRDLRPVAQHCLGFLSRVAPARQDEHVLPARIPGRRAMRVELGREFGGLTLLMAHLSLTHGTRHHQLDYLSGLVGASSPTVLMGDLNCDSDMLCGHGGLKLAGLSTLPSVPLTYPSWRPRVSLDHILVSPQVEVHRLEALPHAISDHLPLAAEISLRA